MFTRSQNVYIVFCPNGRNTYDKRDDKASHEHSIRCCVAVEQFERSNRKKENDNEDDANNTHLVDSIITCTVFRHCNQHQEVQHTMKNIRFVTLN